MIDRLFTILYNYYNKPVINLDGDYSLDMITSGVLVIESKEWRD
jgi:hypothetical protein